MTGIQRIYDCLRDLGDPTVDRALAAALPTADAASLRRIVDATLERRRPEGLLGLIRVYHQLPAGARQRLLADPVPLYRPLREAMGTRHAGSGTTPPTTGRANALAIIRDAGLTDLAYLATETLRHGPAELTAAAADTLLHLTRLAISRDGDRHRAGVRRGHVQPAVEQAVCIFPHHRRREPLRALLMLLPDALDDAGRALADANHPAVPAMAALLGDADDADVRRAALPLLAWPALAQAAVDCLREAVVHGRLGEAVTHFHLLALRPIRQAIEQIKATAGLSPDAASLAAASGAERLGLIAFAAALPDERSASLPRLMLLRKTPDPAARLLVLRRLLEMAERRPDAQVDAAIAEFCHDADVHLARIALWRLIRSRYAELPRVLAGLVNSRHEPLRRLAGERLAPMALQRLWVAWPTLDAGQRLTAGRAIIKIDPHFHRSLGDRLVAADRDTRLRSLAIIGELNQGAFFTPALLQLAQSTDHHVASAAVRALGSATGDEVTRTLEACLHHPDARVRANAVEALSQRRSTDHLEQLVQMIDDPDGRPRANAIAALLEFRTGDAIAGLQRMLDDSRPGHRHSALWLIETVGLLDLARNVAEVSISDPDRHVQTRAQRVVSQLLDLMHHHDALPASLGAVP